MIVVKYDPLTNHVTSFQPSGEASADDTTLVFHDQNTKSDVLDSLYTLAKNVQPQYMLVDKGVPREMTAVEKSDVDAAAVLKQQTSEVDRISVEKISAMELLNALDALGIVTKEDALNAIYKYRGVDVLATQINADKLTLPEGVQKP